MLKTVIHFIESDNFFFQDTLMNIKFKRTALFVYILEDLELNTLPKYLINSVEEQL